MCKCENVQMCKCLGNVRMFGKCVDAWEMCECVNVQMCKCLGNVRMFGKCVDVLMCLR